MYQKVQAIVLQRIKYNDRQHIVVLYTRELGRVSCLLPIVHSKRSNGVHANVFQMLSLLELELSKKGNNGMYRIKEARNLSPWMTIPFDPVKLSLAMFLSEFLFHLLKDESGSDSLFVFIQTSLQWLDASQDSVANFHIAFLIRLLRFLGLQPNVEDGYHQGYFDMIDSCFTMTRPMHRHYLQPEQAVALKQMLRIQYATMHLYKMSRSERVELLDIILQYYRLHLTHLPDLQSVEMMRSLFD